VNVTSNILNTEFQKCTNVWKQSIFQAEPFRLLLLGNSDIELKAPDVLIVSNFKIWVGPAFADVVHCKSDKLHINNAALDELQEWEGIGSKLTSLISEYRKKNVIFHCWDDIETRLKDKEDKLFVAKRGSKTKLLRALKRLSDKIDYA